MNSCTICLKDDLIDLDIYTTDCKHLFCKECLDDWFKRGNKSCPLCRSQINTYKHNDENYKLVIYERNISNSNNNNNNNNNNSDNIIERGLLTMRTSQRMYAQNIRLKIYSVSSFLLFAIYFWNYMSFVNDYHNLEIEYELCSDNNTNLQNQLDDETSNKVGTSIEIFDGSKTLNCFYPNRYFGCSSV